MKHLGLFEGIGGFSLAARWAGWETVAWCEINEFCQKVLKYYFPKAEGFSDITKTDFTKYANKIDIITGGFPCQPYSQAGKRLGKEDERHLWPEMLRAIREVKPKWVVGENVRGLTNWNEGLVFDEVQADLEAIGYEVQSFILPACAVNAPHRRDRVWIIAYSERLRLEHRNEGTDISSEERKARSQRCEPTNNFKANGNDKGVASYTNSNGQQPGNGKHEKQPSERGEYAQRNTCESVRYGITSYTNGERLRGKGNGLGEPRQPNKESKGDNWENFPTQSPVCGGNDGLPTELDGITFSKWRNESIKAYGNAVVPQVIFEIFQAINDYKNGLQTSIRANR